MSEFVAVAKLSDVTEETGHTVEIRGRLVALFQHQGTIYAIDDICPHMGASLGSGAVCEGIVSCPWHGWRFRVTDGTWADAPQSGTRIPQYSTKVDGETILVEVDW